MEIRAIAEDLSDTLEGPYTLMACARAVCRIRRAARDLDLFDDMVMLWPMCCGSIRIFTDGLWNEIKRFAVSRDRQELDLYIRDIVVWSSYQAADRVFGKEAVNA